MIDLGIELAEGRTAFEPGEELAGTARWNSENPIQMLELRLFWFTRGKGTEDAGVVQSVKFEQPLPRETRSFRLRLPEAPYSFSGKLISLVWALELILHPSKEVTRLELQMAPGKREVRLDTVEDPGAAQRWLSIKTR
jgi:hypothetical protein